MVESMKRSTFGYGMVQKALISHSTHNSHFSDDQGQE